MRILLSNDDGIDAPGLAALYHAVSDLGAVTVAAPDSPQSAAGHGITLKNPLTVRRLRADEHEGGFDGLRVDGRPADCVRLAIRSLMPEPPQLVLSGINRGANVGINIFYSGTVAAAAEAAMLGYPAIAFSVRSGEGEIDWPTVARLCRAVLDRLLPAMKPAELVNVNIPSLAQGPPRGVHVVPQSTAGLTDTYLRHIDEEGTERFRLGDEYGFVRREPDTDVVSLSEGFITVTPLHVDMTDGRRLRALRELDWPALP
ncbi:MAG TPA: 5'/3'-nucleotidase SurE [Phycisphaerales bacterium]|nr:5'/3'-nucleotidase SurE [Phycisphaerales bacterium]